MIHIPLPVIISIILPLWVWLRIRDIERTTYVHVYRELVINLFFVYGCALIITTMRPFLFRFPWVGARAEITFDIHLFEELRNMAVGSEMLQLLYSVGNVVMFMPLGFFMPLLFLIARHFLMTFLFGLSLSLTVEMIQMLFTLTRRGTVDDLVFNTIGVILGFALFRIMDDAGWLRKFK